MAKVALGIYTEGWKWRPLGSVGLHSLRTLTRSEVFILLAPPQESVEAPQKVWTSLSLDNVRVTTRTSDKMAASSGESVDCQTTRERGLITLNLRVTMI